MSSKETDARIRIDKMLIEAGWKLPAWAKEEEINVKTIHPEFIEWKWIAVNQLPNVIVDFKKKVYENLVVKISNFIN